MSNERQREAELANLLLEVAREGWPDSDLIARYAQAPESLSQDERAEVEAFLAEAPHHADVVSVVKRPRDLESRSFSGDREPPARGVASPSAARRAPLRTRAVVLRFAGIAAAAALLAAVLLQWGASEPGPDRDVVAERTPPPEPTRPIAPEQRLPRSDETTTEESPAPVPVESQLASGDDAVEVPLTVAENESATPSDPVAAPRPDRSPSSSVSDPSDPSDPSDTPTGSSVPDRLPPVEPILVAMVEPRYAAPAGVEVIARVGGAKRSGDLPLEIAAIAPPHVGRTSAASPDLFWSLDRIPTAPGTFLFSLGEAGVPEPIAEAELAPTAAGLQRISLRELGVELPEDADLRWSVSWEPLGASPASAVVSVAWLRRADPSPELAAELAAGKPGSQPAAFAAAGFWYDAVSSLMEIVDRQPGDADVGRALRSLLDQGELESVATPNP